MMAADVAAWAELSKPRVWSGIPYVGVPRGDSPRNRRPSPLAPPCDAAVEGGGAPGSAPVGGGGAPGSQEEDAAPRGSMGPPAPRRRPPGPVEADGRDARREREYFKVCGPLASSGVVTSMVDDDDD